MLNEYENLYRGEAVMGIDEAGRGPLCGPLAVGCCILPEGYQNEEINDSKKLTARKREKLFEVIKNDAVYWKVLLVDPETIDRKNIYAATRDAMKELALSDDCRIILTDAMPFELPGKTVIPIIKGDAKSISIAAASILAKVTRDRIMEEYDRMYPEYEFAKHKGYPTKRHLELLERYGVLPIYRKSYRPVAKLIEEKENPDLFHM
ncbi:MAG: ribonuclease HII [Erysipelotrichaceae bacterium]|nr:ribonuclease HII [Erysipelotrichaceae bacterium]